VRPLAAEQLLQLLPTPTVRAAPQILTAACQEIEDDQRGRLLHRQPPGAGGGRVQALLQRGEVPPLPAHDELAVEHHVPIQLGYRGGNLWEVPGERALLA
jgi:hypothetical protein